MRRLKLLVLFALALPVRPQSTLVKVIAKPVSKTIILPAEMLPFLSVGLHAKISGYVDRVLVDRGSFVKEGELLIELSAPELKARIAEAESKVEAAEADRTAAEAQLGGATSTRDRLKDAAKTPGAIAGNELILAEKQVDAAQAVVNARRQASDASRAALENEKALAAYLKITAPFAGVVTDRLVHPGALVGPNSDAVLLVIQQVSHLRLVVPVPEEEVDGMPLHASVSFQVPAQPGRTYTGTVARVAHALDQKTRTMAVELDVSNNDGSLAPGMYPSVQWPVRHSRRVLWVPPAAIVTTTERSFVIRNKDGKAEWVDVRRGATEGGLVEVIGDLHEGDEVIRRASDEMREGTPIAPAGK